MTKFTSVYVGKYASPAISKKDIKKLNELGLRGYIFGMGDYYSIKVASYPNLDAALKLEEQLKLRGFEAFHQ